VTNAFGDNSEEAVFRFGLPRSGCSVIAVGVVGWKPVVVLVGTC